MAPPRPSPETLARVVETVRECGGSRAGAARKLGVPVSTLKQWLHFAGSAPPAVPRACKRDAERAARKLTRDRLGRIADLLERSGIPLEEVGRIERVKLNEWQGLTKGQDGEPVVTDLSAASLVLTPKWADGPAWPVVQPAPLVQVEPVRAEIEPRPKGWRVAAIWPDIQIGYYYRDGALVPTHDEPALAVALEVTAAADPDVVVMVGDTLDFPELGKFRQHPPFARTTQASIDRASRLLASIRARVRPECRIIWLAGNHEERLPHYVIDNASAAFGLKRASSPKSWPVLSVPHLCRFDEHDATFLPGYPANVYWINDSLQVIHGSKVRTGGSSAHAYLPEIRHSVIFGHVHRHELATVTRLTKDGPRTYHAACFGALCRIDGSVPGFESGYDLDGVPIATVNNWTQGLGVVTFTPGAGDFAMESVEIWSGRATWRGRRYVAPADLTEAA